MAVSFVGSKIGTFAATTAQTVSLTDLKNTSNTNATLQQDDIVVVVYANCETFNTNTATTSLTPTGYTAAHTDLYLDGGSEEVNLLVSYKIMGGSPDTSVTLDGSRTNQTPTTYAIYAFRGVDLADPFNPNPTTATDTGAFRPDAPSITPAATGCIIMAVGATACSPTVSNPFTNPSGMSATTNHFLSLDSTSGTGKCIVGVGLKTDWASGAYNPAAFGGGPTVGSMSGSAWAAVTLVLEPLVSTDGTVNTTLDAVTTTSAAALLLAGVSEITLAALTATSDATLAINALASPTLSGLTSSSAGTLILAGTVNNTLASLTMSSATELDIFATFNKALAPVTTTSAAALKLLGSTTYSLAALTSTSASGLLIKGASANTLSPITSSSTGGIRVTATVIDTLEPLTAGSVSTLMIRADAGPTLDALTMASTGVFGTISLGQVTYTLSPVTGQSASTLTLKGIVSRTLGSLTSLSAAALRIVAAASSAMQPVYASATATLFSNAVSIITLAPLTTTSNSNLFINGITNKTFAPMTGQALAIMPIKGLVSQTFAPVTLLASSVVFDPGPNAVPSAGRTFVVGVRIGKVLIDAVQNVVVVPSAARTVIVE